MCCLEATDAYWQRDIKKQVQTAHHRTNKGHLVVSPTAPTDHACLRTCTYCRPRKKLHIPKIVRNFPVTPTPSIFSKVLPYKWEAYCRTNGSRIAVQMGDVMLGFPFFKGLEARKVQRYKWGAYCRTNWRCTGVRSSRPVMVGVSEALLRL